MTKLQLYFSYGQNHNLKEINISKPIGVNQVIEHCDVKTFAVHNRRCMSAVCLKTLQILDRLKHYIIRHLRHPTFTSNCSYVIMAHPLKKTYSGPMIDNVMHIGLCHCKKKKHLKNFLQCIEFIDLYTLYGRRFFKLHNFIFRLCNSLN